MNLAIVFGMGISSDPNAQMGINPDFGTFQSMVRLWIQYAPQIFVDIGEPRPESNSTSSDGE